MDDVSPIISDDEEAARELVKKRIKSLSKARAEKRKKHKPTRVSRKSMIMAII